MADYYAWTDIKSNGKRFKRGAKVTKTGLGSSDEEWKEMIRSGSIRSKKFPAPDDYQGSAIDYAREQLKATQEMSVIDENEEMGLAEVLDAG